MIQKLAVLVVEKADGSLVLTAGSRGEIVTEAKRLIRETSEAASHDVARITALSQQGVLKERTWKGRSALIPASPVVVEDAGEEVPPEQEADAAAIRAALKAKGVNVPPRIGVDKLLALAVEHGVEV